MAISRKYQWFKTEEKLKRLPEEIAPWRFKATVDVKTFDYNEIQGTEEVNPVMPKGEWKKGKTGMSWGSIDSYMWLKTDKIIPKEWEGEKVVGIFDFGKAVPGMQIGAETLMYLNGVPYKGVDTNHSEVVMPKGSHTFEEITFRCWSGIPDTTRYKDNDMLEHKGPIGSIHKISSITFGCMDEKINVFYYDVIAMVNAVEAMKNRQSPIADRLLAALNQAYTSIDPTLEGDAYREQLYVVADWLKSRVASIGWKTDLKFSAIGQSHIDHAWLWRIKHTREKIARTFSTVLRMMEQYPDYIYMQSQPQLLAYLKEDYPHIFAQIKERVSEGRFELDGAMWLECDCNIPSGESFVRQILYGKKFLKDEFGIESKYLWMPDVFGYSWALPQILRKSGVDTFCTTKMAWNQYNRMPFQTFNWRGIDGTEVLTHLIEDVEYIKVSAENMCKGFESYPDGELTDTLISPFGYGDGGGGPTDLDLELLHRFNDMPGMPAIEIDTIGSCFDQLHETVENAEGYVHTWDGELYLELHRGTLTSQAFTKKYNRRMEFALTELESLKVAQTLQEEATDSYDSISVERWWKKVLENQFHDIIPGSSIAGVYEDAKKDYERITQEVTLEKTTVLEAINGNSNPKNVIYNASGWQMDGYVNSDGKWRYMEAIKPLGFTFVEDHEVTNSETTFSFDHRVLETPFYTIGFDDSGRIVELYDKEANRNVIKEGGTINRLVSYEDKPLDWEAWDIDAFYKERALDVDNLRRIEMTICDEEVAEIELYYDHLSSTINQTLRFYKNSRRIDFVTDVDWNEHQRVLRVLSDVSVRATKATYDIQYGNCERPTNKNTSWDFARFEVAAHKWMDMSEYGYGVAMLNDCKYGHDVTDSTMGLTLIKSGIWPDPNADQGRHEFTYALLPHIGDWRQGEVEKEAWKLNNPFDVIYSDVIQKSIFRFSIDEVAVDAVKLSENGDSIVLRVHEYAGGSHSMTISSDYDFKAYAHSDLMESTIGTLIRQPMIEDTIKPYEIKTYKVYLK